MFTSQRICRLVSLHRRHQASTKKTLLWPRHGSASLCTLALPRRYVQSTTIKSSIPSSKTDFSGPTGSPTSSSSHICLFHSGTTPLSGGKDNPHDKKLIQMSRQRPVNFLEIEDLLASIEKERNEALGIHTFVHLVKACTDMKSFEAAEAAEKLVFDWMMKFYTQGRLGKADLRNIFGMAMQAWVRSGHPSSGKRAEHQLDMTEDLARKNVIPFVVDTPKYNTVMKAYAIHGDLENAKKAFDRCKQAFQQGNESARPDLLSWGTLIDACAKSNQRQRAELWLEEMYKDYKTDNASAQPDVESFNIVIDMWAQSGSAEGAQRGEQLLNHMIKLSKETSLPVRPNTLAYRSVITAYTRQGLPREAERVLARQHEDFKAGNKNAMLNVRSLNSIIHAWAKAKDPISGERAECFLNCIVELHKEGHLRKRPDSFTYNSVINAWAVSGNPERAAQVFGRMLDDYKKGNANAKPELSTFRSLMGMHSNSGGCDAGPKADDLLDQLKEFGLKPDLSCYVSVIKCWRVSSKHGHPMAKERCREVGAIIDKLDRKGGK